MRPSAELRQRQPALAATRRERANTMIVSRAPVRFSLGGGGTDLPSYSSEHGGFLVAAAIDKYVYVCVARRFSHDIRLAYSETEIVESVDQIRAPHLREALQDHRDLRGVELHSLADVPANTGPGLVEQRSRSRCSTACTPTSASSSPASSSRARRARSRSTSSRSRSASRTSTSRPYGGVSALTFNTDGASRSSGFRCRTKCIDDLEANLAHLLLGRRARGVEVLKEQAKTITENSDAAVAAHAPHQGARLRDQADPDRRARSTRTASSSTSTGRTSASSRPTWPTASSTSTTRPRAQAGAIGGKLMGAGGGGFFMFYVRPADRRRVYQRRSVARGLRPVALPLRLRRRAHRRQLPPVLNRSGRLEANP